MKKTRNNRKVKRTSFKRQPRASVRVKSNRPRKSSSTKVSGKVGFVARTSTMLRRILPLKH